jgi:hypothetical protein
MSRGRVAGQPTISAQQINTLHEVLMQPGHSTAKAAKAAGISHSTAASISRGSYKLHQEAQAAWDQTFGVRKPEWTFGPQVNAAKIKAVHQLITEGRTLEEIKVMTGLSLGRLQDMVNGTVWFRDDALSEAYRRVFETKDGNPFLKTA